jgi:predicted dehydrogenase
MPSSNRLPRAAQEQGDGRMKKVETSIGMDRREFLGWTTAASAAAVAGFAIGRSATAAPGSNDRIRLGLIGIGWRGGQHLDALLKTEGCELVALCDPEAAFLGPASVKVPQAKTYVDMRKLLEDPAVDAVVISTCNHWHCLAAIWACAAGKDVYVEKPLSYTLWEGRQLINAARKFGRIVQVGTQQRSDPVQAEVRRFLHHEKAIGSLESVVVTRFGVRAGIGKRATPLNPPTTLDYDLWLGPAADRPIYRDKINYDWHWDWNTGNGECANWGVHVLDDVRNVAFQDTVSVPSEVTCGGGRVVWNDAGDTPNLVFSTLKAADVPVVFALSNLPAKPGVKGPLQFEDTQSGYVVNCAGGSYHGRRGGGVALDRDGKKIREFKGTTGGREHYQNFFAAVRSRDPQSLNAETVVGHDSTNWSHMISAAWRSADARGFISTAETPVPGPLGVIRNLMATHVAAYGAEALAADLRLSPTLTIDPACEAFVGPGADAANAFLGPREFRGAYTIEPIAG